MSQSLDLQNTERETLRELALSDRDTAPVYYELYIEHYGEPPEDDSE